MSDEERLIETVARELKRPVQASAEATARIMEEIRRDEAEQGASSAAAVWNVWRRYRVPLMAAAAIAFMVALSIQVWRSVNAGGEPLATVAVRNGATRPVQFVFVADEALRVSVVGDFNDWDPEATPLLHKGEDVWSVVVPLTPGRYRYSFLVNGDVWVADASSPRAPVDDFGVPSSILWVEAGQS